MLLADPSAAKPVGRGQPIAVHSLFGIPFIAGTAMDAIVAAEALDIEGPRMIVTANVDHILSLAHDRAFRAAYASAAVRTLDGMPLLWLARIRGGRKLHRVTGHDLLTALLARRWTSYSRLFVVSPNEEVSRGIVGRFVAQGADQAHIRTEIPPFGFEHDQLYSDRLASHIRGHHTTTLLMGIGAPKSEIWIHRQGALLGSPVALCVGGALAVCAGIERRAPVSLQRLGLEWFWRFRLAPRRLFHRYFIRSWRFPLLALKNPDLTIL